jgi:hypothetical protein
MWNLILCLSFLALVQKLGTLKQRRYTAFF